MKEWTREESYRELKHPDEIRDLYERIQTSAYRQRYHVQPMTGLSNDPNGFALHKGVWHLCYQWCPWGAVHGLKYWYHVTSADLVHWRNAGIGLKPDCYYDNRGVYSGSAISVGDDLVFFFTGNHRDEDWTRTSYTCAAVLGEDGRPRKLPEPLFGPRDDHSEHQRDPKVVWNAAKGKYYVFIGAQTLDKRGCALVYESAKPLESWRFAGELKVPGYERFGGMWECPCIMNFDGKDVLIFSPQHIRLPGRGERTNHNVYLIGHMDYDALTFIPEGDYHHLDYGFDFYAAQGAAVESAIQASAVSGKAENPEAQGAPVPGAAVESAIQASAVSGKAENPEAQGASVPGAAAVGDPDRAILIAWIGLPDCHYPTQEEDWEGTLSLPRELRVRDGKLLQTPLPAVDGLRGEELPADGTLPAACNLEATAPEGDFELNLFTKADGSGGLRLRYDSAKRVCALDRTGMDNRFNENVGEVLDMPVDTPLRILRVYIDRCSTEIFANDGEATFTTRTYPTEGEFHWTASDGVKLRLWPMKASVSDEFVL